MMLFDIGANRGDACYAALNKGFTKIIALEPAPRIYRELVNNFIYSQVVPIKMAVSDTDYETVEFYEADEDGLSSLNKDWLTAYNLPYAGKPFRTIRATTITMDTLVDIYGTPDLTKIDVEGAEWFVFRGMSRHHGLLTFEWTDATITEHQAQIEYLAGLGYSEVGPQFIVNHLDEPDEWFPIDGFDMSGWVDLHAAAWIESGWRAAGLRPTADVGMCWVR